MIISSYVLRLLQQLTLRRKKQLIILLFLMATTSVVEVVGIGAVVPFLGALVAPDKLSQNELIQQVMINLNISGSKQLLQTLTIFFVVATVIAGAMRLLLLWAQTRLGYAVGTDLSLKIYKKTLYQPYSKHTLRNSSEVISGISNKVNLVVLNVVMPLIAGSSAILIFCGILMALLIIDPIVTTVSSLTFGFIYAFIIVVTRRRLKRNSLRISIEYNRVMKTLQEGLGGIRDVLIDGTQAVYCKLYHSADYPLRKAQASNQFIGASPRFFVEALGVVLIALLAHSLIGREDGVVSAIPTLGAIALGAQRMLPLIQQLYSSWSSFRGSLHSFAEVLDLLEQPMPAYALGEPAQRLPFSKSIKLVNVNFRYSNQSLKVLENINIEINKGLMIGFMGATGSGKSTLLDILMALLEPEQGSLQIDGVVIDQKNFRSWQSNIAHVPQAIFLTDSTVAQNIAFGVPDGEIDYEKVRQAAQQAQIAATIESLEHGYETFVGERGVRLSGGQRQRIGIARALYKSADVIVLDEATSALDNETESAVIETINSLGNNMTILMVAHRISTLKGCDVIYRLKNGRIEGYGNYQDIIAGARMATVR